MTEKTKVGTKVVTGKVRFSYANVFTQSDGRAEKAKVQC